MSLVFDPITQKLIDVQKSGDCVDTSVVVRRKLIVVADSNLEIDANASLKIKRYSHASQATVTGHVTVLSDGHLEIDSNSSFKVEAA